MARFFTVTGTPIPSYAQLRNCQRKLTSWYRETFPSESPHSSTPSPEPIIIGDVDELSADEIIEHLSNHPDKGAAFRDRFEGGWGNFGSNSEARFSLMGMCNPYTRQPETIGEILRRSGLWTDKLEKRPKLVLEEAQKIIDGY